MATLADLLIEIGVDAREVAKGAKGVEGTLKKTWAGAGKMAAIGGAAIGAALMAGIDSIVDSSKPLALLTAQLGGSEALAAEAGKAAGDIYAKGVVGSMEDATGAVKAAIQNALVPPDASSDAIAAVANKISNLSTTMEEDAGRVSSSVSQMIRTGLVDTAEEGFDLLQRGTEMGINKAEDLLDTFNEYGTQFRKFGLDGQTAMGLLSQGLKGGARDADVVADSIKEMALRIGDGTTKTAGGFKMLGMNAKTAMSDFAKGGDDATMVFSDMLENLNKIKDPAKKNAAALAVFGTKFEDLGDAAFSLDMGTAVSSMGDVAGAADKAGKTLEQSAGAKLESFKRKAQGALVEQLAKAIPLIESTVKWIQKNSEVLGPLVAVLGLLAAALGVAAIAQWAMNSALLASPITWLIVGIAAVVAGVVLLATQTTFFQDVWNAVWGFLKMIGAWFAGPFAGFFVTVGSKIKQFALGTWQAVATYFGMWAALFRNVRNWAVNAVSSIVRKFNTFVSFVRGIPGRISGALSSIWDPLKRGFRLVMNWVISKWNSLSFNIPSITAFGHSFGGGSIGVPKIPQMAHGGVVPPSRHGRLVNVGEAGKKEAIIPLHKLPDMVRRIRGKEAAPHAGPRHAPRTPSNRVPSSFGPGNVTVVVQITPGGELEFRRWINKTIRVKGAVGATS